MEPKEEPTPPPAAPPGEQVELPVEDPPPAKRKRKGKPADEGPTVQITAAHKSEASSLTRNVYERRAANGIAPATPFPGALMIAARMLALGYERQNIGEAMYDAPTITVGAVEFALRHKPRHGKPATSADERRGGLITDRAQVAAPWVPGQSDTTTGDPS